METSIFKKKFLEHYLPVKDRFEKYCLVLTGDSDEAKDLVSEAILISYEGFSRIRDKQAFIFYLFKIAKRLNYKRYKSSVVNTDYTSQKLFSAEADPFQKLCIKQVHQCIRKLPAKIGTAIILYEISGFSVKEVSEMQKSSESATKVRLMRGRRRLKEMLTDDIDSIMKLNRTA